MSNSKHFPIGAFTFYPEQSPSYLTGMMTIPRLVDHLADRACEGAGHVIMVRVFSCDGEDVARMSYDEDGKRWHLVMINEARKTMKTELLYRALDGQHANLAKAIARKEAILAQYR